MIEQLNPAQRLAVETTEGPVLIVAGPGSGKTRVIVHRIAHLIAGRGVPPWHVLAVTFTNRAAREMLTRLQGLLPRQADSVTMGTFHAVFARILRRDGARIGVDSHFVIYDDGEQLALVKRALGDLNLDEKYYPARAILHQISLSKSVLRGPQEYANQAQSHREEIVAGVYRAYQERLAKNRALDFDDILSDTVRLFREHPDVLEQCQERYRYILVDEFQDTNVAQYELVKLLGRAHRNVCVVGDEDQSIYSWRSANIHNILDFGRDFPGSQTVVLDQNYRSTQMILTAAQGVIQANRLRVRDKHLWTANPVGQPIVVNELSDADHEASYVASEVARHLVAGRYRPRDIAVMFRTNAQSRAIEQQFLRDRIPHRVIGVRFWERQEVKDVLAYLRVIVNPADNVSFTRIVNVPPRGIGARTVAELDRWAGERGRSLADALACAGRGERQGLALGTRAERALAGFAETLDDLATAAGERTLVDLISSVLERTGYDRYLANDTASGEDRLNNVEELMGVAKGYARRVPDGSLAGFLEEAALYSDTDEYDAAEDAVTVMTLHSAKGLEFPVVFLTGLEEGLCPHSRSRENEEQLEEERRLFYVGITRAKERLYLTYALSRGMFSGDDPVRRSPSSFLADLPSDVIRSPGHDVRPSALARLGPTAPAGPDASPDGLASDRGPGRRPVNGQSFKPGDRVRHAQFGLGIVSKSVAGRGDEEVEIVFQGVGLKRLSLAFAQLEKV